jgi:hypothetical protein
LKRPANVRDIENDAIDALVAMVAGDGIEIGEPALDEGQATGGLPGQFGAIGNRCRIAVNGDHRRAAVEDRTTVTAGPEGAVDESATGAGREETHDLLDQHRNMAGRSASDISADDAATRRHVPAC